MDFAFISVEPPEYPLQTVEEFLPAVPGALIIRLLIRAEAGLLHANVSAALRWSQRPEHLPLKSGFASPNTPAIGQALDRIDDEHLAVDHTIPDWRLGIGPELEFAPGHRLEVVGHHPLRKERTLG